MCGVVGIWGPAAASLENDLAAMSSRIAHRGPDDHGVWVDNESSLGLGHRRLAIVDLTDSGHQPMESSDGRWVIVLNGEIYDHLTHRARLERQGVVLRGHSDTEVLLELIAADGPERALASVDGMFALAVWDRRDRTLVLARDRLGEKPLYYGRVGGAFVFASELTAIRSLPRAPAGVDHLAVAEFLRYGFVPAPLSILPNVQKLPAGCILRVTGPDESSVATPYWSLEEVAEAGLANPIEISDQELVDRADRILRQSVDRRLMADVPVGAFLSGGVDSSVIVAIAQAVSSRPVRTFTVAVGGDADESLAAAQVARHLGTDHTTLALAELDPLELALRATTLYDEPFADPSGVPTFLLCAAAREHVTVCLSGDGADELLGGYNRYRVASGGLARLRSLPGPIRRGAALAVTAVAPGRWDAWARYVPGRPPDVGTKAHKLAAVLAADDNVDAYAVLARQWDPNVVMRQPVSGVGPSPYPASASALARMMLEDQRRTLPDDMLVKVDRASMAVALEVRVPFLDHRFVEFSWRLPERAKVRDGVGKWLTREVLSQYVPVDLWNRPKVGFDPPLAGWLRGPLSEWAHDLLSPVRLSRQGLLRPEPIARALAEHHAGDRNHDYALWTVLMLQSWLDRQEP